MLPRRILSTFAIAAGFLLCATVMQSHGSNHGAYRFGGTPTFANESSPFILAANNVTQMARLAEGPCRAVTVANDIVYMGSGGVLRSVDFSNRRSPRELGRLTLPAAIRDILVREQYAYVAAGKAGLHVIAAQCPASLRMVSNFETRGYTYGLAYRNQFLFVAEGEAGIRVLDITNPAQPQEIGAFDTEGCAYAVAVRDSFAYVADGAQGLRILDISNPAQLREVGFFKNNCTVRALALREHYVYLAQKDSGLVGVEVSNPRQPAKVCQFRVGYVCDLDAVLCDDNLLYLAFRTGWYSNVLVVVDNTNIERFVTISSFSTSQRSGTAYDLALDAKQLYFAHGEAGLRVFMKNNVSQFDPDAIGHFPAGDASEIKVAGDYAYVGDRPGYGMRIVDLSEPGELSPATFVAMTRALSIKEIEVGAQRAYVSYQTDEEDCFRAFDLTNPINPTSIQWRCYYDGGPHGLAVNKDYLCQSLYYGLEVTHLWSDSAYVTTLDWQQAGASGKHLALKDHYALLAALNAGLLVVDIGNPIACRVVGLYDTPGQALDVAVSGEYAYVADRESGIRIFDFHDPEHPVDLGSFATAGAAEELEASGQYVYVAAGAKGLRIIDVANANAPFEAGYFETGGTVRGVALRSNQILLADGEQGIYLLKNELLRESRNRLVSSPSATGSQNVAGLIHDGAGNAIISWMSNAEGLLAQKVDASGSKSWDGNGILLCPRGQSPRNLTLISDGKGGAIFAWSDYRRGSYDIYAQRADALGAIKWQDQDVPVCTLAANNDGELCMISDGNNGAVMAWSSGSRVRAQRIYQTGNTAWSTNGVRLVDTESAQSNPAIANVGFGNAVIVWNDTRLSPREIFAQRLYDYGSRAWGKPGMRVSYSPAGHAVFGTPAIVPDGSGGVIVLWRDWYEMRRIDLRAQRLDALGHAYWGENGMLVCHLSNLSDIDASGFVATTDGSGGVIVAWDYGGFDNADVYAQRIDHYGNKRWGEPGILISNAPNAQKGVTISEDGAGGAIIAWAHKVLSSGFGIQIYAQRVSHEGERLWAPEGQPICDGEGYRFPPLLTRDGLSGAFLAWDDLRSGQGFTEVYLQWLDCSVPTSVANEHATYSTARSIWLYQNYPNPFNPQTEICFEILRASDATLRIFNVLGEEIRTLVNAPYEAGYHRVLWDGKDKDGQPVASGVYLYQLRAGAFAQVRKMSLLR